ncbi:HNH endonuclease [bacterium]
MELPRGRWVSLQEIYTLIYSNVTLEAEDFEPQEKDSSIPKWQRNVRNTLQTHKNIDIEWDGEANYRFDDFHWEEESVGEESDFVVNEGIISYVIHKKRERCKSVVTMKKKQVLENDGVLKCEVCDFVFEEYYGEIGKDYIECHHVIPLSESDNNRTTNLDDLSIVCANCHRMIHRKKNWLSIDVLKEMIPRKTNSKT